MISRLACLATVVLAVPLLAQTEVAPCPSSRELRQRASQDLLRDERLRSVVGARPLVLRVSCEDRDKDTPGGGGGVGVAYVVGYETGVAAEVTFGLADFRTLDVQRMPGVPQSTEEEREAARGIVREQMRVPESLSIDGGFVVDPPPGAAPGRYLVFLISARARGASLEEVVVDLTRRTVAPRRKY